MAAIVLAMRIHRKQDFASTEMYALRNTIVRASPFRSLRVSLAALAVVAAGLPARADSDVEARVTRILSQMTLEEKVGQLNLISHGPPLRWEDIQEGRSGALLNFNNAQDVARAQSLARKSRLQIPPLFGLDVIHGFRTQFPVPLGEAAAFNPRLSRRAAELAAREAAYVGVNWTFAPMADLSRDSRWGRIVRGIWRGSLSRLRSHRGKGRGISRRRTCHRDQAFRRLRRAARWPGL